MTKKTPTADSPASRYAQGVKKYWSAWVHAQNRGIPKFEKEAHELGELFQAAPTMSEEEFQQVIKKLWWLGVEDGDLGYLYWSGVIDDLKRLRASSGPDCIS